MQKSVEFQISLVVCLFICCLFVCSELNYCKNMSLLSRFRRTVLPSSSRSKKTADDDVRHYNYRKPTKSFNEKSVKSKSSPSYAESHDAANYYDGREKSVKSNNSNSATSKLSTRSSMFMPNKSTKVKSVDVDSAAALSRSDTFTLEEEANLKNGTYPRSKRKDKSSNADPYRESNAANGFDRHKGKQKSRIK